MNSVSRAVGGEKREGEEKKGEDEYLYHNNNRKSDVNHKQRSSCQRFSDLLLLADNLTLFSL